MYALAAGGSITIFDILGNSMALPLAGSSGGSIDWNLIGSPVAIPTTALISRIEFRSTVGIYFDDLSLSYDSTTPGGVSLPEPAGLALVALALAGLGLTRRLVGRPAQH